jgi:hypothetical protein
VLWASVYRSDCPRTAPARRFLWADLTRNRFAAAGRPDCIAPLFRDALAIAMDYLRPLLPGLYIAVETDCNRVKRPFLCRRLMLDA